MGSVLNGWWSETKDNESDTHGDSVINTRFASNAWAGSGTSGPVTPVTGVILAGGRGSRMGGVDKGLVPFAGRPLVEWVMAALTPQVERLLISANRNLDTYRAYGHAVVTDLEPGYQGPLAGMLSAMRAAGDGWILTLPCDGPLAPPDLRSRLAAALAAQCSEIAVATDGRRTQFVHALLPVSLAPSLERFLASGGRRIADWYAGQRVVLVDFGDQAESFVNLNAPDQALDLERHLSALASQPPPSP